MQENVPHLPPSCGTWRNLWLLQEGLFLLETPGWAQESPSNKEVIVCAGHFGLTEQTASLYEKKVPCEGLVITTVVLLPPCSGQAAQMLRMVLLVQTTACMLGHGAAPALGVPPGYY